MFNVALSLLAVAIAAVLYGPAIVRRIARHLSAPRLHRLIGQRGLRAHWAAWWW